MTWFKIRSISAILFSVYQTEHPGYHLSLAKMDSAPSSSVVGIQTGNGSGSGAHGHLNSSGLKKCFC